jgi:hypothetical protein
LPHKLNISGPPDTSPPLSPSPKPPALWITEAQETFAGCVAAVLNKFEYFTTLLSIHPYGILEYMQCMLEIILAYFIHIYMCACVLTSMTANSNHLSAPETSQEHKSCADDVTMLFMYTPSTAEPVGRY